VTRAALALLLAVGAAPPARAAADDAPPADRSVYRVDPALDGAILGVAGVAALVPYLLQHRIIDERCPCDPSEVPRFERWVVGNRSQAADVASDTLAALAIAVPVGLDALDVGGTRPLLQDGVVYAEALLVNGALVTTVKDLVQRPTPRAYAGDADIIHRPTGYRAFYSATSATRSRR
jgi:hypothetical protein